MSARGRPLRFLALVSVGWVGARIFLLWPAGSLPEAIRTLVPDRLPSSAVIPPEAVAQFVANPRIRTAKTSLRALPTPALPAPATVVPATTMAEAEPEMTRLGPPSYGAPLPDRLDPLPDRWSVSSWFAARSGSTIGNAPGSQLGGSQAGARLAYRLPTRERLAAFARLTAPLQGKGREAALGVEWQPTAAPVRLIAEQRFGLDGAPGGTGLGVVAGAVGDVRHFRLEAYGQAGAIARRRIEPYADGAARFTRPVGRFSLGAGAWGAAQRDAQRLDIGPTATLAFGTVRLSLDWRQRIAGRARPGSGLALTLGGDI